MIDKEDDKIKSLFERFEPSMGADDDFMERLERNMDSVELIRERIKDEVSRSRKAAFFAAVTGMGVGAVLTTLFYMFMPILKGFTITVPHLNMGPVHVETGIFGWIVIALSIIGSTLAVYRRAVVLR